jgi:uncharacterized protein YndB with AHSA1/START domain
VELRVELDQFIESPPQEVWKALTDPALLALWLMPNDFEPRVGKRFTFVADCPTAWEGDVACEVLELVPNERMVWSWQTSGMERPTRVVFELSASGDGTRLRLRHAGEADEGVARDLEGGWPRKLASLASLNPDDGAA